MTVTKRFLARDPAGEAAYMFIVIIPENARRIHVESSSVKYNSTHTTKYGAMSGNFSAGYIIAPDSNNCEEITEAQFETYKEMANLPELPIKPAKFLMSID